MGLSVKRLCLYRIVRSEPRLSRLTSTNLCGDPSRHPFRYTASHAARVRQNQTQRRRLRGRVEVASQRSQRSRPSTWESLLRIRSPVGKGAAKQSCRTFALPSALSAAWQAAAELLNSELRYGRELRVFKAAYKDLFNASSATMQVTSRALQRCKLRTQCDGMMDGIYAAPICGGLIAISTYE